MNGGGGGETKEHEFQVGKTLILPLIISPGENHPVKVLSITRGRRLFKNYDDHGQSERLLHRDPHPCPRSVRNPHPSQERAPSGAPQVSAWGRLGSVASLRSQPGSGRSGGTPVPGPGGGRRRHCGGGERDGRAAEPHRSPRAPEHTARGLGRQCHRPGGGPPGTRSRAGQTAWPRGGGGRRAYLLRAAAARGP